MTPPAKSSQKHQQSDRSPYFQFFADDWISGTLGMTFEERGFFVQVLAFQWARKASLPLNLLPAMMATDPRTCRRLVGRLIALGKLSAEEGMVSNARMNEMLSGRRNRSNSQAHDDNLSPDFGPTLPQSPAKVEAKSDTTIAENSTISTKPPQQKKYPLPLPYPDSKKFPPQPASSCEGNLRTSEPAASGWRAGGGGIFDLRDLKTLEAALGPMLAALHGEAAWRAGLGEFAAKLTDGEPVHKPAKLLAALVLARASGAAASRQETNRERTNRLVAEGRAQRAAGAAKNMGVH
jgi:uncharacterized protein YdaU (DUF1376 family)